MSFIRWMRTEYVLIAKKLRLCLPLVLAGLCASFAGHTEVTEGRVNPNAAKVEDAARRSAIGEIQGMEGGLRLSSAEVKP